MRKTKRQMGWSLGVAATAMFALAAAWAGGPTTGRVTLRPESPAVAVAELTASRQAIQARGGAAPSASVIHAFTPERLGSLLKYVKLEYEYTPANENNPPLFAVKLDDYTVSLALYDKLDKAEGYQTATLVAGFKATGKVNADAMNTWNAEQRFAKAYLNKEGNPRLEMDVVFCGGVTPQNVSSQIAIYRSLLKPFVSAISK